MYTTENNKKLAEFIEANKGIKTLFYLPQFGHYQNSNGQIDYVEVFREDELKFHNDWNWLMEVVEKILTVGDDTNQWDNVLNELQTVNRNNVYNACIEFVEWYNKNN